MLYKCRLRVNGGEEQGNVVSISGDPGLCDQKQCFRRRWERTVIQPDPRRLVSVFQSDFITQTRQTRQAALYEHHHEVRLENKTFQADV